MDQGRPIRGLKNGLLRLEIRITSSVGNPLGLVTIIPKKSPKNLSGLKNLNFSKTSSYKLPGCKNTAFLQKIYF